MRLYLYASLPAARYLLLLPLKFDCLLFDDTNLFTNPGVVPVGNAPYFYAYTHQPPWFTWCKSIRHPY
jgi:hypothetical protein